MKAGGKHGIGLMFLAILTVTAARADTRIGEIHLVDAEKKEIIVRMKSERPLHMGERVYAEVNGQKAFMTATFPMLSSSKCALEPKYSGYLGKLAKGMSVYTVDSAGDKSTKAETASRGFNRVLGGSGLDVINDVRQTRDGGYIIIGSTASNDGSVIGNHGNEVVWIVKLDASGNLQWQRCLGGGENDRGCGVRQTADGGFIIVAETSSSGGDVMGNHGMIDIWVVKLDASGNLRWQRCYGGSNDEMAGGIEIASDGGYILIGTTNSGDGDVTANNGGSDMWVVKLNSAGHIQWQRSLGGSNAEEGTGVVQMRDGGYLAGGRTSSTDGDVSGHTGSDVSDGWLVMLDVTGQSRWQRVLSGCDSMRCSIAGLNGNDAIVVLAEEIASYRHEGCMYYSIESLIEVDPAGLIRWRRSFRDGIERSSGTVERVAGGYMLAYVTEFSRVENEQEQQFYLTVIERIDESGRLAWRRQLGGDTRADRYYECEAFVTIRQTGDGGYILAGTVDTGSGGRDGNSNYDIFIAKLDQNGTAAPVRR